MTREPQHGAGPAIGTIDPDAAKAGQSQSPVPGSRSVPTPQASPAPRLSVVIPAFNEIDNLEPLLSELNAALLAVGQPYEVVLVDDGSSDGSAEWIAAESARDPRVVGVLLEKNGGQSAALAAGLARVRGEFALEANLERLAQKFGLPRDAGRLLRTA